MRVYSDNVKSLLSRQDIGIYFCVEIQHSSGYLRHTTLPQDVTVGGISYTADNNLMSVEPPKLSSVVDREAYKITYTDPNFTLRSIFEAGLTGAPIQVLLGFINTTASTLGGALPGAPLTNVEDTVIAYAGAVDTQGYSMQDCEEITVVIEGASPMSSLNLLNVFYTSQDALKQYSSTDTAFDQVYAGSKDVDFLWGKA